jgi:PLAC8 family
MLSLEQSILLTPPPKKNPSSHSAFPQPPKKYQTILVLVGQVMTRMSRDMFGGRGPRPSMSNTCKTMTGIFLFAVLVQIALSIVMDTQSCFGAQEQYNEETLELEILCPDGTIVEPSTVYSAVRSVTSLVSLAFMIYVLIATCRTRQAMRKKYKIEPTCCGGCEDCCCSFWCSCCTVSGLL